MAINLLPWREDRYYQSIKNKKRYGIFCMMIVLFFLMGVRHIFIVDLESIKKQNHLAIHRSSIVEAFENKRDKTIWLIGFLANLSIAVQDNLYVSKIAMRENLIRLDVYADNLSYLERFIEKIKKQGGIGKVTIDSSATHGGIDSDSKENRFILTLNLDNRWKLS